MQSLFDEKDSPTSPTELHYLNGRQPGSPLGAAPRSERWRFGARRNRTTNLLIAVLIVGGCLGGYIRAATMRKHYIDIVVRPQEEQYFGNLHRQEQYTWTTDRFLPQDSLLSWTVRPFAWVLGLTIPRPVREHAIATFPRQIELNDDLPQTVQAEEIVFGFVTPYSRAKEMSEHWDQFLRQGANCLVVLPPNEASLVDELTYFLRTKRGFKGCRATTVDLGQYPRYEHRVLDLPRRMFMQTWTDAYGKVITPKYYVVGDDDTAWLDLRALQREMSLRDYTKHHMSRFSTSIPLSHSFY